NFMCHKNLLVEFNRQVTCIVGSNGSGKSAIMVGIGVVFGAKASAMDRGGSLKGLVRAGESGGTIKIQIRNSDYRVAEFGQTITVEKRLYTDGPTRLRILSESGVVLGRTFEDLLLLMEHFRISVKNPVSFLTQDQSKQILRAGTPKGLYRFFKAGTDIEDTEEMHQKNQISVQKMQEAIVQAEKKHLYAQKSLKSVETALEISNSILKIESELDKLKVEKEWADTLAKAEEKQQKEREKESVYAKYVQHSKTKETILQQIAETKDEIGAKTTEWREKRNQEHTHRAQLEEQLVKERKREAEIRREIEYFHYEIDKASKNITRIEGILGIENNTTSAQTIEELERNKETHQIALKDQEKKQVELEIKKAQVIISIDKKKAEIRTLEQYTAKKTEALQACQNYNPINYYGPAMAKAIATIKAQGIPAIGPLGLSIVIKDEKWSRAVEAALGQSVYGFIVHTQTAKSELEKVFQLAGVTKYQIYITQPQEQRQHDCILAKAQRAAKEIEGRAGTAGSSQICTVLSQIDRTPTLIIEQLIILLGIERLGLVQDRGVGYSVLQKRAGYDAIFTQEADKIQYIGRSLSDMRCLLKDKRLLVSQDQISELDKEIKNLQVQKSNLYQEYTTIQQEQEVFSADLVKIRNTQNQLLSEISRTNELIKEKKHLLADDLSIEHSALVEKRKQALLQIKSIEQTHAEVLTKISTLESNSQSAAQICTQTQQTYELSFEKEQKALRAKEESLLRQLQSTESAALACKKEIDLLEQHTAALEKEHLTQRANSLSLSQGQVLNPSKSSAEIDKDLITLQAKLSAFSSEVEISADLIDKKDSLVAEISKLEGIITNNRLEVDEIAQWTEKRIQIREQMLKEMSEYAAGQFAALMEMREYQGSLIFNHQSEELEIKVHTAEGSRGNKNLLSGGERSFSGICFLLSLWRLLSSPFRILDEFDVFMDGLNRKAALHLIVETARDLPSQIILITPQGVPDLPSDLCQIISLKPPAK
ncbi:structural maintenance of chromosomes protein 6, partial [Nematocida homosporus]|uniref:structural maintenance of chromosomes protein 6 n=1 Tax=Nematocida homosporus TaxID=1912981 RepID=UPI002220EB6A